MMEIKEEQHKVSYDNSCQQQPHSEIYLVTEGIQSPHTLVAYRRNFKHFIYHIKVQDLQVLLEYSPKVIESFIIDYIKHLRDVEKLKRMSIEVHLAAIMHFFDMNDFPISIASRKKFKRFLPPDESTQEDRPYTTEEIRQILDKCYDERSRVIILLMVSTGMRIGAIHTLQIGDLTKIQEWNLYKILVYAHSKHDRYYTFCTPECANAIDAYLEYRRKFGEDISRRTSPLIREQFNIDDKIRIHFPKSLSKRMIVHLVEQSLKRSGLKTSGEVMRSHGLRKAWITHSIKAKVDYNAREYLVGHRLQRNDPSYDRTSEEDRLQEYLKLVDLLTISPENTLRKEIQDKNQIINHKLQEKDDALTTLSDQVMKLMEEVELLKKQSRQ
jgi:integrase